MKTTTLPLKHSMNCASCRFALLIPLALACFALSPQARGTCQQECLTNANTVFGDDALSNQPGDNNTAIGFNTLKNNVLGDNNTAIGTYALSSNTTGSTN